MNVLSLFDGMSCGQLALQRAGIKYKNYFASEINNQAIKVTQSNFPDTVQLGDIKQLKGNQLPKIDLILAGSPCQGFSFCGKGLNFKDPRSVLFFDFIRLLKETKPRYYILENVRMKKEYSDVISKYLQQEPIQLNSSLVSAQNRIRLYWTNIPYTKAPKELHIKLRDILTKNKTWNKATIIGRKINKQGKRDDYNKAIPTVQYLEVRGVNPNKCNCLTTVAKDNVLTPLPIGRHPDAYKNKLPYRNYTVTECCRLQTVPDDYFTGTVSDNQALKMLGNGWTVDIIVHLLKGIKLKNMLGEN